MNDYDEDWDEKPQRSIPWDWVLCIGACVLLAILIVVGVILYFSLTTPMPATH